MEREESGAVTIRQPGQRAEVVVNLVPSGRAGAPGAQTLVNVERTTRVGEPSDLVDLARQVQKAEEFVRARAVGRLEVVAEQIRHLQETARRILDEARRDDVLHRAACNLKKVPGNTYYLYRRPQTQQTYFSLLSPDDWGAACPNEFLGAYRLEHDMSWTPEAKLDQRRKEIDLMDQILSAQKTISSASLEFESEQAQHREETPVVELASSPPSK